jgi:predicted nucleic acid-binding protein
MNRIVVCDTGPLLHLSEAGCLEFLQKTGDILIPPLVESEFARHAAGFSLPAWIRVFPLGESIEARTMEWIGAEIDAGEAQAIGLAYQEESEWFLTDDGYARRLAESLGLETHGSLGVLLWAAVNGCITDLAEAHGLLDALAHSSLWVSKRVLEETHRAIDNLLGE